MARFNSSARGERFSARAFLRKASRPPLWSTLLIAFVETRRRTLRPSASEMNVTLHRFGRKRRLVLMLEWLTLWPTRGPLAVSSQRRDIVIILAKAPAARWRLGGSKIRVLMTGSGRTYRADCPMRQGFKAVHMRQNAISAGASGT